MGTAGRRLHGDGAVDQGRHHVRADLVRRHPDPRGMQPHAEGVAEPAEHDEPHVRRSPRPQSARDGRRREPDVGVDRQLRHARRRGLPAGARGAARAVGDVAMSLLGGVETGSITPSISMGPGGMMPLNPMVSDKLIRTVVDATVLRPDMFELTFMDREGIVVDEAMISIGTEITISLGSGPTATDLIVGEVTSIEGDFDELVHHTIVRGYEHAHRLQRARRSRTFLDSTDGDIARKVAGDAGLKIGDIQDPGVTHQYVAQVAQTDWEFLKGRAVEIGYETGVVDGEFFL